MQNYHNLIHVCMYMKSSTVFFMFELKNCVENVPSSLLVQDLVIKVIKMRDVNVVKLTLCETCLYTKPSTMLFMFEFKHCVQNVYSELYSEYTHIVNENFKYFVTFLGENCIIDKCDAVYFLRKIYNKKSNIECEIIVYALDNIINSVKKCTFYC